MNPEKVYEFTQGTAPLLLSMPHDGTDLPPDIAVRMTPTARSVPDTDWHMHLLYDFARELGCSIIKPLYSRYVVDLNRPPNGESLYPGQRVTELCPTWMFDGDPVYEDGKEPDQAEIARRVDIYWHPYHQKVRSELARLRDEHGVAMLFEAHSIRGVLPELFEGKLPDLNLGTNKGQACDPVLRERLDAIVTSAAPFTGVTDGRFTGGYLTRVNGKPDENIHAVQLEQVQDTYMDEFPPFSWRPDKAAKVQPHNRALIETMLDWAAGR
jgi:N-formylglutamate deformylase